MTMLVRLLYKFVMSCCLVTSHGLFCYFKGPCHYVSHHPIFIQQRHKGDWSLFQMMLVERQGTLWTSGQVIPVHILVMCSLVQRNMESFVVSNYPSILPIWSDALWQKTYQGSPGIFLLSLAWQDRLFYLWHILGLLIQPHLACFNKKNPMKFN